MEVPPDTWLRVIVQGATRAGLAQLVRDALGVGVVDVRVEDTGRVAAGGGADHQNRSPHELFDMYLQREGVADDRIRALFAELVDLEMEGTDR